MHWRMSRAVTEMPAESPATVFVDLGLTCSGRAIGVEPR
jgi:hypothetical protein